MKKVRCIWILFLIFIPNTIFSQNLDIKKVRNAIDSLSKRAVKFYSIPDSALMIYSKAEKLAFEIHDTAKIADVWSYYGFFYYSIGHYRKSVEYSKKAKQKYYSIGDSINGAWAGYTIGLAYKYWGKYREALQEIQNDIKLFERFNDKDGKTECYIVAGYINQAWRNFDEAERICRITLKLSEELGNKSAAAYSQLTIGNSFAFRHQYDSANYYFKKALKNFQETKSSHGTSLSYRDIGSFFLQKGDVGKAFEYYHKSLTMLKNLNDRRGISEVLALMGSGYLSQKDYLNALKYLKESQDIALDMELNEDIIKNYLNISIAYEKWGKKDVALEYHKKYTQLKDSIFDEEKHFQIAELQTRYETEKKEQQIALKNVQIEKYQSLSLMQRYLIAAFVLAFILASIIAFLAIRWYRIKQKDNKLLSEQKQLIEIKNKQITDSINYACRIQGALLGRSTSEQTQLKEHFIFYQPKDIVSGDFYYIKEIENYTVIAAADCTGHGVPGAFMSMLGITLLNEIFSHSHPASASEILEQLRFKVKEALNQTIFHSDTRDGMDIALCLLDNRSKQIQYAGAYQPLILIRENELIEYKATRNPVGVHVKEYSFENHIIQLQPKDSFYIFSDGFADQVGGLSKQKYRLAEFKKFLVQIHQLPMGDQPNQLQKQLNIWKMDNDQTDDILVVGFKV